MAAFGIYDAALKMSPLSSTPPTNKRIGPWIQHHSLPAMRSAAHLSTPLMTFDSKKIIKTYFWLLFLSSSTT